MGRAYSAQRRGTAWACSAGLGHHPTHQQQLLHRNNFRHRSFCTQRCYMQQALTQGALHTQQVFSHSWQLVFTQGSFYTKNVYTEKLCTQQQSLHTASLYAQKPLQKLVHTETFTHGECSETTQKLLRTASFSTESLHTDGLCARKLSHKASFFTERLLHT